MGISSRYDRRSRWGSCAGCWVLADWDWEFSLCIWPPSPACSWVLLLYHRYNPCCNQNRTERSWKLNVELLSVLKACEEFTQRAVESGRAFEHGQMPCILDRNVAGIGDVGEHGWSFGSRDDGSLRARDDERRDIEVPQERGGVGAACHSMEGRDDASFALAEHHLACGLYRFAHLLVAGGEEPGEHGVNYRLW